MKGSRPWLTRSLTNFAVRTERRSLGGETAQPRYDGSCDTPYNPRIGRRLASARALRLTTDRYSVSHRQNGVGPNKTCADAILPKGHNFQDKIDNWPRGTDIGRRQALNLLTRAERATSL